MRDSACFVAFLRNKGVCLLTQTESLDDGTVAVDVAVVEVIKECAALAYELCEAACCLEILVITLQVLREVLDAEGEKSNLALC